MARNKIVFCHDAVDGLTFLDMGRELSSRIAALSSASEYASACKRIFEQTCHSAQIGAYLAIQNLGILFEPEMKLDLRQLIDSFSINKTLFIHAEGEVVNDHFYFCGDSRHAIPLQGLSYIEI